MSLLKRGEQQQWVLPSRKIFLLLPLPFLTEQCPIRFEPIVHPSEQTPGCILHHRVPLYLLQSSHYTKSRSPTLYILSQNGSTTSPLFQFTSAGCAAWLLLEPCIDVGIFLDVLFLSIGKLWDRKPGMKSEFNRVQCSSSSNRLTSSDPLIWRIW